MGWLLSNHPISHIRVKGIVMQNLFLTIDRISTFVGHLFAWLVVGLTGLIGYEVFSRYVLNNPHAWAFDAQIMLYGTMFMMAGAYTLAKNGHVRGDILYGFLKPRTQAIFDLVLYIPGVVALAYAGYSFAADSWRILEHSSITADGPPLYPFKTILPIAGVFLLLQGLVEIFRCIVCIKQGEWPSREQDVEEVDVDALKAMVGKDKE
jgi:TRAP-type mannitol/chloroaromatic compound transport system permease small subunit